MTSDPFRLFTYNLLAPEYADHQPGERDFYALTRAFVPWERRGPALVNRIASLDADVLCLQEVSHRVWRGGLHETLEKMGYSTVHVRKRIPAQPDGSAVAWRTTRFSLERTDTISFEDGTGYVAIAATLRDLSSQRELLVIGAHLKWSPDDTVQSRQLREVLTKAPTGQPTILCGDLNFDVAGHDVWKELAARGFATTYPDPAAHTWAAAGRTQKVDAVLFTPELALVEASPLPTLSAEPGLPSADEPSDHLPLGGAFRWAVASEPNGGVYPKPGT